MRTMSRQVCFIVVGVVLIVGFGCRPTVREAGDESQADASSDPQRKKPEESESFRAKPSAASPAVEPKNSGQDAQRKEPKDGGWGYSPKEPGNTSVFGWQLLALTSAKMAGLQVDRSVITRAGKYLDSAAVHDGTEYAYRRGLGPSASMTAVGLLCRQYLGVRRDNPMLSGGEKYLLDHLPDEHSLNACYCYYAQHFMHNMSGYEWDTWNRATRDLLVRTQIRDTNSCSDGSWDPANDAWGTQGGRLMKTSLSVLPLQVYYLGLLPLYKPLDW